MRKKREKLLIVSPSGKEFEVGFLSPCKEGVVLGVSQKQGIDTSHLTVLNKKGLISSHITPQYEGKREYFSPITKKEIVRRIRLLIENQMLSQLTREQLSQNMVYFTKEFFNLLDSLKRALYQTKNTKTEKIHILNFKRVIEKAPKFLKRITDEPQAYFGVCKVGELLIDKSRIVGIINSKTIVFRHRKKLYGIDFSVLMAFDFTRSENHSETRSPLSEIYESFGITQYMQELEKKKILEKLFKE